MALAEPDADPGRGDRADVELPFAAIRIVEVKDSRIAAVECRVRFTRSLLDPDRNGRNIAARLIHQHEEIAVGAHCT